MERCCQLLPSHFPFLKNKTKQKNHFPFLSPFTGLHCLPARASHTRTCTLPPCDSRLPEAVPVSLATRHLLSAKHRGVTGSLHRADPDTCRRLAWEIPCAARSSHESSEETPPATQNFIIPKKEIHTVPDMGKWKRSQAYADYIGFILTLNEGVKGKKLSVEYVVSEAIEKLVTLLNTLDRWIDETPPVDQPSRFGNKAFRTWYAKLNEEAENLVATVIPTHLAAAVPEVAVYLKEAVGNSTRIDYGTGHEAAFAAFLCCLCKIGVLRVDDQIAIVFKVFSRYLEVMRKLQKTYRMEPAGSQGVWGLDDFQFLPFIWGSSQLIDHPFLEPRHFVDEKAVNENHKDYMFLECILFITEMKTGPFAEHSNQLWNISAVPSWSKVNQGLIRMYKAECLEKFPVIQHFKFGSLLPIHPVASS